MSDVDDFLTHHGVKGMRWGRRKSDSGSGGSGGSGDSGGSGGSTKKAPKHTETRREHRKRVKQEAAEFQQKKLEKTFKAAETKGDNVLIKTMYADGAPTIVTGKEFVRDISSGRMFNANVTEVFGEKRADGRYHTVESERYTKSGRR